MEILQQAMEVFARGFCFTRSFTHPYLAERVGKIWVVGDAPRKRGNYRREQFLAHGVAPEMIDRTARKHTRSPYARFTVLMNPINRCGQASRHSTTDLGQQSL